MKKTSLIVLLGLVFLGFNCRDDFNPPEVSASYPTQNATGISNNVEVWIEFSESMDYSQTETAFSLFADTDRPKGQFIWERNRLRFIPRGPLTTGRTYTLLISKSAEDSEGNNLRDDFQINFTVNPDAGKPQIVSTNPVYGQTGILPNSVFTFVFSEAVNPSTLIPGITITPSVVGAFTVNGTGETVTFTPQSNLLNGTVYTISINTNVQDLVGNNLLQGRTISFVVGTDFVRPTITSTVANPSALALQNGLVTPLISRNDQIVITFSELMNTTTLTNAITISPTAGFSKVFATVGLSTVATLTFSPALESETLYTLSVNNSATDIANNILNQNYNYQFTTNAADSIRPTITGVRQAYTILASGTCTLTPATCPAIANCVGGVTDVCNNQALSAVLDSGSLLQNSVLIVDERVDIDTAATTDFRHVLKVYFDRPMDLQSLVQATTYTAIVSGPGTVGITDIQLDATLMIMSVYIRGWAGTGYHRLKIAGGTAKDNQGNALLNDYLFFHN